jgi:hypothetical protein
MCSEKYPVDCHRFWMVSYYFATLEKPFQIVNIISEDETQTFNEVLNEIDIVKYKSKFYKENSELESISFFPIQFPKWVEYWDALFLNIKDMRELKHKYANIEIGYTKGADVDD